jgi:flagellar biosynthetic protein FliR
MTLTVDSQPLIAYLLASVRIVAWLLLVPPFSSRAVPPHARALLALGLAFAVAPGLSRAEMPVGAVGLAGTVLQEALVGASMGFATYLVFAAVQAAGDLIDVFGGFSLAAAFDPMSSNMNSVFGRLYQMLATMLLFVSDAHLLVVGGLLRTFERLPVGSTVNVFDFTEAVSTAFGLFFVSAVQIALPLIGVLFVADLGLALLTKVAPALNAIGVMFPAKIALTLMIVGLSFPVLPDAAERLVEYALDAMTVMS